MRFIEGNILDKLLSKHGYNAVIKNVRFYDGDIRMDGQKVRCPSDIDIDEFCGLGCLKCWEKSIDYYIGNKRFKFLRL